LRPDHGTVRPAARGAVDAALVCLATELELAEGIGLRQGDGNSIVVRNVGPEDLWRAMDRAVPDLEGQVLFFAPIFL
jgi:hypothetical protein